jgi:hypothetical protein
MASNPEWLHRVPDICTQLQALHAPVVDRAVIERLFGVRRRQAIQLMHRFGGYQAGKTFLLETGRLAQNLQALADTPEFHEVEHQKRRLSSTLDQAWQNRTAHTFRIPVSPSSRDRVVADLPPGITLIPGRLMVEFTGVEDLMSKLYEVAQAAANDFDAFSAATQ